MLHSGKQKPVLAKKWNVKRNLSNQEQEIKLLFRHKAEFSPCFLLTTLKMTVHLFQLGHKHIYPVTLKEESDKSVMYNQV